MLNFQHEDDKKTCGILKLFEAVEELKNIYIMKSILSEPMITYSFPDMMLVTQYLQYEIPRCSCSGTSDYAT